MRSICTTILKSAVYIIYLGELPDIAVFFEEVVNTAHEISAVKLAFNSIIDSPRGGCHGIFWCPRGLEDYQISKTWSFIIAAGSHDARDSHF